MYKKSDISASFYKYQSLGNDFLLFDCIESSMDLDWQEFAKELCVRRTGVGADGVLVLSRGVRQEIPTCLVVNADGSNGGMCLNGARCVALHLVTHHGYPEHCVLFMGDRVVKHHVCEQITQHVPLGICDGTCTITIDNCELTGHVVNVGNPHFVILQQGEPEWLRVHGRSIEHHPAFPNRTNIEFVSEDYNVLVYERGCGMTQACSSGAAAIMSLLYEKNKVGLGEEVLLSMPGGCIATSVKEHDRVVLRASAQCVFTGFLPV